MAKEFDIKLIKESKKSNFSIADSINIKKNFKIERIDLIFRDKCIAHIISLLLSFFLISFESFLLISNMTNEVLLPHFHHSLIVYVIIDY